MVTSFFGCMHRLSIDGAARKPGKLIVALFVDPTLHRSGVGSALMTHVNKLHGPLSVEVFADNPIGLPFYEKHGFKLIREEENPLYPGQSQWIMGQDGAER